jgi:hypothetical protein
MKTKRLLGLGFVAAGAAAGYAIAVRPRMLHWGATEEEVRRELPGDRFAPERFLDETRAVTIDAPPSAVWPWLVQMGYGRAGWYSHDIVERLMCSGKYVEGHSADRIHPELQHLSEGDEIPFAPWARYPVVVLEPERNLTIGSGWQFALEELTGDRTRLIVRTLGPGWVRDALGSYRWLRPLGAMIDHVVGEPLHFAMERKMMLGIKERAEASVPLTPAAQVWAAA